MMIGSQARVWAPKRQGAKFLQAIGTVVDVTRSLEKHRHLVYFLQFDKLGIRCWFDEDQLMEVQACRSDEDDPAA